MSVSGVHLGLIHFDGGVIQCFPTGMSLTPRGHLAISADTFGCHNGYLGVLLASRGWRPGLLLQSHSAQDSPPPHTHTETYPIQKVNQANSGKP